MTTIREWNISYSPFYGCDDSLIIYCGASARPSGWPYYWNYNTTSSKLTVVWGITGDISLTSDFAYVVMEEEGKKEVWLLNYIGDATTVEIPSEIEEMPVTKIYKNCFYGKSSITSVTIPSSVTSIGPYAFSGCSGLTSVTFGENSQLTTINEYAFGGCSGLTSISIPSSVTLIGDGAFKNCSSLAEINFNTNLTKALTKDSNVFYNAGTSGDGIAVTFGEDVTSIPAYLFGASRYDYASKIKSITIPAGVTSIGGYAFKLCTGLEEINFNATLTTDLTDESQIFYCAQSSEAGCVLKLGEGIKTVPAYLFHSSSMTSITIPDDVTSIGEGAFRYCDYMTTFTIPERVTTIGEYAFCNCSGLEQITIPSSVKSIDSYAFAGSGLTSIEIPKGITTIKSYTFKSCTSLTSVIIPDSVTTIEEYAFQTCNFTSITIPNTVKSIGLGAFNGCTNMTSITIPFVGRSAKEDETKTHFAYIFGGDTNGQDDKGNNNTLTYSIKKVVITGGKTIAGGAFYNCALNSIIIQGGVETIGDGAFRDCSHLRSLVISTSVKSIGSSICYSKNSEFESVYYAGTNTQWENCINNIGKDNDEFNQATKYYYSESEPTTEGNYWHYVDGVPTIW